LLLNQLGAALKSIVDDYSSLIDQATLASFLESGAFYAHLRRCRKHYAERQSYFLEQVSRFGLLFISRSRAEV
jgi:GntR family transcriptional regulator / MocR family aminotransferase